MMFRRHMQDIRQRMDHLNNLVEVKGHKDLRDLVVLDAVVEVEIDSSKGNLQFIILQMLEEESRHGYQIIKDLEERFKGFYSPVLVQFIQYYKCWKIETLYRFLKGNKKSTQLQMKVNF